MEDERADQRNCLKDRQPILLCSIFMLSALTLTFVGRTQDVSSYLIAKGQMFSQSGIGAAALMTNDHPYSFLSFVDPSVPGSVKGARLRLPAGLMKTLSNEFGDLQLEQRFATKTALDTAFGTGPYTFLIEALNEGMRTPTINFRTNAYPSIPHLANWEAAQDIEAAADFTLTWDAFPGGTSNDFIHVLIENETGQKVFESPGFTEPEALNGTNTLLTIPVGTFIAQRPYSGRLLFVKRAAWNTSAYPGAVGLCGYYRETLFNLNAAPPSPAQGRLQFDASAYKVDEIAGVATIKVIRIGGNRGQVSVDFSTVNEAAVGGFDYMNRSGTLTFFDGETSKTFDVSVWDDWYFEGNESLRLLLSRPMGGAIMGTPSNAALTVVDNEFRRAGVLQFSLPDYVVSETNRVALIKVTRSGGAFGAVSVDFSTSDGTANDGWDYTNRLRVLTFAPGQTSTSIAVPVINDTIDESNETVLLYLSNPTGGASLGPQNTARLVIKDNDAGGILNFRATRFSISETSAVATIVVRRTRGLASGVTVDYRTQDGTAIHGFDYMENFGTLTFEAGELTKSFIVPLLDDDLPEGDETIRLLLSNATGGARLGSISNAVLNVLDDELALQFSRETYSVSETGKLATIAVTRSGPTNRPVSVDYITSDGTAIAGLDYIARSGTLTLPAGVRSKVFSIPIINDSLAEGDETLSLALSNPMGTNAFLGPRTNAVLTILDNDSGGVINFRFAAYRTNENAGQAIIAVTRSGGAAGGVTVDFATSDNTALAGTHYVATKGTLTFGPGQAVRTFAVPLLNNTLDDVDRTVLLTLSKPTGGAVLGAVTTVALILSDDD